MCEFKSDIEIVEVVNGLKKAWLEFYAGVWRCSRSSSTGGGEALACCCCPTLEELYYYDVAHRPSRLLKSPTLLQKTKFLNYTAALLKKKFQFFQKFLSIFFIELCKRDCLKNIYLYHTIIQREYQTGNIG